MTRRKEDGAPNPALTFQIVSKEDPKHGRWILPIVIAGLIGFTYVFVNALPAADVAASTTTTIATTTTTAPTTTTSTTLPADMRAFLLEVDRFEEVAKQLDVELNAVNDAWEAKEIDFDAAHAGFTTVSDGARVLADEVTATSVPDPYVDVWPESIALAEDLVVKADAVIAGLEAPDDGTARREAVAAYDTATADFVAHLDVVRAQTPE